MKKFCLMFPGQGSQKTGMGKSLVENSKKAKLVFECASDVLHYDMFNLCTTEEGSQKLLQTNFAQPAIVTVSLAAFQALVEHEIEFSAVVGHSLGSISAITAAGVVSMQNCFEIVKARGEIMQQCENNQTGSMCAVIGNNLNLNYIETICKNASDYVICANFNGTNQVVLSGKTNAIDEIIKILKEKTVRCVKLKVKAAFHSKLMENATNPFQAALENIEFNPPKVDVFSNVTGKKATNPKEIKKLLVQQITRPVLFTQNLKELGNEGFQNFIELGPNKPLCAMVKSTLKQAQTFFVCDKKSLDETLSKINELK